MSILLYGATGFVGQLVAQQLALSQTPFSIAGRDLDKLRKLQTSLLDQPNPPQHCLTASLDHPEELDSILQNTQLLLNTTGPNTLTGPPLVQAALRNHCHYLDASNEQKHLHHIYQHAHPQALQDNLCLLPGCAFQFALGDLLAQCALDRGALRVGLVYRFHHVRMSRGTIDTLPYTLTHGLAFLDSQLTQRQLASQSVHVTFPDSQSHHAFWFPGGEALSVPLHSPQTLQVDDFLVLPRTFGQLLKHTPNQSKLLETIKPLLLTLPTLPSKPSTKHHPPQITLAVLDLDSLDLLATLEATDPYPLSAQLLAFTANKLLQTTNPSHYGYTTPAALFGTQTLLDALHLEILI